MLISKLFIKVAGNMSKCLYCQNDFSKNVLHEKYCSLKCQRSFNNKKHKNIYLSRLKTDPSFYAIERKKHNDYRRKKYSEDPLYRAKRLKQEMEFYKKSHRIFSQKDFKKNRKGKGGITSSEYRKIYKPTHPNAWRNGDILEHVFVMSEKLGRPLTKDERVHHKNGIKTDNTMDNLELWSKSHPYGQRVEDKINWCREFLQNYGYDIQKK